MTFPNELRYEPETKTIRTVPGNHWVATVDSWDKAIDTEAIAKAMCRAYNQETLRLKLDTPIVGKT